MQLYKILALEYKNVFPSSLEKAAFIESFFEKNTEINILDIGCASGELALQLADLSRNITGIDTDAAMINEAASQCMMNKKEGIQFIQDDMIHYLLICSENSFDTVVCLGNTLAYLDGYVELEFFLEAAKRVLNQKGRLIIQILNYSNPSIRPGFIFPSVETDRIIFEREYRESGSASKLDFATIVTDKISGEIWSDNHKHHRFLSTRVKEQVLLSGFSSCRVFGGYDKKEAETSDFFHILAIEK